MSESHEGYRWRYREGIFGAISAGFFFLLVGAIFIMTPGLFTKTVDFFNHWDIAVRVPNTMIYLPAPEDPRIHQAVYLAVEQFSYVWGVFQIFILALRFIARSPWSKKAETTSNFVFWIGAGYLISTFRTMLIGQAVSASHTTWFAFWSTIIILAGVSLIVRAIVLAAAAAAAAASTKQMT